MKAMLYMTFLLITLGLTAQNSGASATIKEHKVTALTFSVTSPEEFETVNWKDVYEIFEGAKADDKLCLGFEIRLPEDPEKKISKANFGIRIEDTAANLEKMIAKGQKSVKQLIKMATNFKNYIDEN